MKRIMLMMTCVLAIVGCRQTTTKGVSGANELEDTARIVLKYAKGFQVEDKEGYRLLEICNPQQDDSTRNKVYRFALVKHGEKPSGIPDDCRVIEMPIRGIICMTTLQLSGFIKLGALDHIVGMASAKRLFDKELKARMDDGRIQRIGKEGNFDEELVLAANPDAILISLSKRGGFDRLEDSGIPLIPYMGYQETSPLAQAEWIKFVGMLIGQTAKANRLFAEIEQSYMDAKALVAQLPSNASPRALYGKLHGDNWYAMGGESFIAQVIRDAGGTYFLNGDQRSGGVNLDFEKVYAQGESCDFWVIQNKEKDVLTYESLKAQDAHYADFRPWKERKIICCEMSHTPVNELSIMEPDVVLKDIIHAFHPGLLEGYAPKYYKLME